LFASFDDFRGLVEQVGAEWNKVLAAEWLGAISRRSRFASLEDDV